MTPGRYRRLGGLYQLVVEGPDDLEALWALDEARWVASSAPIAGFSFDPAFLRFVDSDGNGRIRADELKAAARWTLDRLADRSDLGAQRARLRLDALDTTRPGGRALMAAARQILVNLGAPEAAHIDLEQVRDRRRIMSSAATNGDGIIPPEAADDPALSAFIEAVGECAGWAQDASGREGVTGEALDAWRAASATLGRRVRVAGVEGVAVRLRGDGALMVETAGGVEAVLAGDVEMVQSSGACR